MSTSVDILNETYDVTKSIDAVLSLHDGLVDYSVESDWYPGDPLYQNPKYQVFGLTEQRKSNETDDSRTIRWTADELRDIEDDNFDCGPSVFHAMGQYVRPMVQIRYDEPELEVYSCDDCETIFPEETTCWVCGKECPEEYYIKRGRIRRENQRLIRERDWLTSEMENDVRSQFDSMFGISPEPEEFLDPGIDTRMHQLVSYATADVQTTVQLFPDPPIDWRQNFDHATIQTPRRRSGRTSFVSHMLDVMRGSSSEA